MVQSSVRGVVYRGRVPRRLRPGLALCVGFVASSLPVAASAQIVLHPVGTEELARERATLVKQSETLRYVHDALAHHSVTRDSPGTCVDPGDVIRRDADLLALESRVHAADRNWDKAARSALDMVDLYIQHSQGRAGRGAELSWWGENSGTAELRSLAPSLPVAVARRSALELMRLDAARVKAGSVIKAERSFLFNLWGPFPGRDWDKWRAARKYEEVTEAWRNEMTRAEFDDMCSMTAPEVVTEWDNVTATLVASAEQPAPRNWSVRPDLPVARFVPARRLNAAAGNTPDVFARAVAATHTRLLAVWLAANAFRDERGRWPGTLQELAPGYLPTVPPDPFSNRAFGWALPGGRPLLYSVGPDGTDDGGQPLRQKTQATVNTAGTQVKFSPLERECITAGSTGDIVYGANS